MLIPSITKNTINPYLQAGVVPETEDGLLEGHGGGEVDPGLPLGLGGGDLLQLCQKHVHALIRQLTHLEEKSCLRGLGGFQTYVPSKI